MDHAGANADGFSGSQDDVGSSLAAIVLEPHRSGEEVDGLVLHAVVLQAQRVTRLDVEDFSYVAFRVRPDQLVAPRLLHSPGHVTDVTRFESGCFCHASEGSHGAPAGQGGEIPTPALRRSGARVRPYTDGWRRGGRRFRRPAVRSRGWRRPSVRRRDRSR